MGYNQLPLINQRFLVVFAFLLPALCIGMYFAMTPATSAYNSALIWVYDLQKAFHGQMTSSLSSLADATGFSASGTLIMGSFLYGVFHAAGPGHGKIILSTYLVTHPKKMRESVALAAASALMQGVVAVFLVYGLFYLFDLVPRDSKLAVVWSERISYLLVVGLGAWIILRGVRTIWPRFLAVGGGNVALGHDHHGHDHHHDHDHHGHHHTYAGHCETCGHAHVPTAEQLENSSDWRSMIGVVLSIGMRPCSGAVLVLIFARFSGIPLAGVLSVFAISIGTALTVSALALLALQLRNLAQRFLAGSDASIMTGFSATLMVGGGALLVLFGYGLFVGTYLAPVRSMGLG